MSGFPRRAAVIVLFAGFPLPWLGVFRLLDQGDEAIASYAVAQGAVAASHARVPAGIDANDRRAERAESCAFFTVCQHGLAVYREANFESVGLLLHGYTAMIFGTRHYLLDVGWPGVTGSFEYLPVYGAFSILFFVVAIGRRVVRYQKRAAAFSTELEQRIDEVSAELAANYEALSKSERRQAVLEERSRITRDMHDGLGGQLMHALQLAERTGGGMARLTATLKAAMQDLRLMIDSMAPHDNDLVALLAAFRHRVRGQLEDCGIDLHWEMEDMPRFELAPTGTLHLPRILQEVVSNAMTHARASNLRFETRRSASGVTIRIHDDGVGFDLSAVEQRGLRHMTERAQQLGANLAIRSTPQGTQFTIEVTAGQALAVRPGAHGLSSTQKDYPEKASSRRASE